VSGGRSKSPLGGADALRSSTLSVDNNVDKLRMCGAFARQSGRLLSCASFNHVHILDGDGSR
jgi:hypothetical protein